MQKRGRPVLPADKKKRLITLKLAPDLLAALDRLGKNRTRLIEVALIKTYKIKLKKEC